MKEFEYNMEKIRGIADIQRFRDHPDSQLRNKLALGRRLYLHYKKHEDELHVGAKEVKEFFEAEIVRLEELDTKIYRSNNE